MPDRTGATYHKEQARLDIKHIPPLIRNGKPRIAERCLERARYHLDELETIIQEESA